jgi:hypothetical protein
LIRKQGKTTEESESSRPRRRTRPEAVIALLDEWLKDESGYDEATWPELKQALDHDRVSERRIVDGAPTRSGRETKC